MEKLICDMTRQEVNKLMRAKDESRLWPINGKLNVTERAINRLRNQELKAGYEVFGQGQEYHDALELEISRIVNDERNW